MKVSVILDSKGDFVATIPPSAAVSELVDSLYVNGVGALVVSGDGEHVDGIVSERDVVRALASETAVLAARVDTIMSTAVFTATRDTPVDELFTDMTERRVRHIPILDEDSLLVGIVSIGDIVKFRMGEIESERSALVDYINRGG